MDAIPLTALTAYMCMPLSAVMYHVYSALSKGSRWKGSRWMSCSSGLQANSTGLGFFHVRLVL